MYGAFKATEERPVYCPYPNPWASQIKIVIHVTHVEHLTSEGMIKIGFLQINNSCFSSVILQTIVQSTIMVAFEYGDILYTHASPSKTLPVLCSFKLEWVTKKTFKSHFTFEDVKALYSSILNATW